MLRSLAAASAMVGVCPGFGQLSAEKVVVDHVERPSDN